MTTEVRVPALGESVTEATVGTWFKNPGDAVSADEVIAELETDKVSLEVTAPVAGTLGEQVAKAGETVGPDSLLATIEEGAGAPAKASGNGADKAGDEGQATPPGVDKGPAEEVEVRVPALGESVTEATVGAWFKQEGDSISADEVIAELETDKVNLEVTSPAAGVLQSIKAKQGETVAPDAVMAVIAAGPGAGTASGTKPAAAAQPSGATKDVEDAPSAKKLMSEAGISPDQVEGTGRDGRIMKEDVQRALSGSPAPAPAAASKPVAAPQAAVQSTRQADTGEREKRVKMTRLRQTIARRLKDAQNTAAMLTTYNEVDMGAIMDLRNEYKDLFQKKHGVKLGFMSFFVKACCHALQEIPDVNAEIDGDEVVYKNYYHVGVAVGTPTGLVVPVVRDADQMSFATIEKTIAEMGKRARDSKLSMAEMQGGTFTISNGGVYGSLMSSPILNPPQSGILGMHKIQERPMVVGGQIVARPMMYLALSYDHRIVDGAGAVTFLVRVKEALEDPRRLLMDL